MEKASKATMQSIQEVKNQFILLEQALAEKNKPVAATDKPVAAKVKPVAAKVKPVAATDKPVVARRPKEITLVQRKFNSMSVEEKLKFIEENRIKNKV